MPVVKRLSLCNLKVLINPEQFAAICELSNLEDLFIGITGEKQDELWDYKVRVTPTPNVLHAIAAEIRGG
jgi:hypothetical protein